MRLDNEIGPQKTRVMGIVNVTPDSFSDGGLFITAKNALQRAYMLLDEGADILDIGAESTRPGHQSISWEEEWRRLEPVLRDLYHNGHGKLRVSVDTTKFEIAARSIELGVTMINDVWGGAFDARLLQVVAEADCEYVWMHNRKDIPFGNGLQVLFSETRAGIETALQAGIRPERLWIDPGIGFAKTQQQNLLALQSLTEYCQLGYPVLLGTSRKRVIGNVLELPVGERLEGSLACVSVGVMAGVSAVRVHDVQASVRTCRMVEAMIHANPE